MAKLIGTPANSRRYQRMDTSAAPCDVELVDVLRARSAELLELGDVRLVMDRAFRWGYTGADGRHRQGLQHVLDELRRRRQNLISNADEHELDDDPSRSPGNVSPASASGPETPESSSTEGPDEPGKDGFPEGSHDGRSIVSHRPQHGTDQRGGEAGDIVRSELDGGLATDGAGITQGRFRLPNWPSATDELQQVEHALRELSQLASIVDLPDIDLEAMLETLSPEDAAWLLSWQHEARGWRRSMKGEGASARFELPPEVATAIGSDILKTMFREVSARTVGEHQSHQPGNAGDSVSETRSWEPGESLDLDLVSTVFNAVKRNPVRQPGSRLQLEVDDFQVVRRTAAISVSTVLALDRSRSMGQGGGWTSARRIALALHELIRRSYPRDSLDLIAFSSTAEVVKVGDLPLLSWDRFEHGTDLQGALALARTVLRRRRAGTRQIVLVTDGEPTLATLPGGTVFSSPLDPEIMHATLREVYRCTRENIVINLVLLSEQEAMRAFGDQVARYNRGRVFHASAGDFGASLLRDYVGK